MTTTKRTGRKRKDPLKVKRDRAGRILESAQVQDRAGTRQAQAQRFRALGAQGVLDPRLGTTLGLMFVLHVPVRIGPEEYDAASWLADRLKAHDEIVLALRRSPPSSTGERGNGGVKLNPLELQAMGKVDEVVEQAARRQIDQARAIRGEIAKAQAAMGGGQLGERRWRALTACCRDEGLATPDQIRFAVEGMVELAWAGGFYRTRRRKARNAKAAWGHDVNAVEIVRVVTGEPEEKPKGNPSQKGKKGHGQASKG